MKKKILALSLLTITTLANAEIPETENDYILRFNKMEILNNDFTVQKLLSNQLLLKDEHGDLYVGFKNPEKPNELTITNELFVKRNNIQTTKITIDNNYNLENGIVFNNNGDVVEEKGETTISDYTQLITPSKMAFYYRYNGKIKSTPYKEFEVSSLPIEKDTTLKENENKIDLTKIQELSATEINKEIEDVTNETIDKNKLIDNKQIVMLTIPNRENNKGLSAIYKLFDGTYSYGIYSDQNTFCSTMNYIGFDNNKNRIANKKKDLLSYKFNMLCSTL